MTFSAARAQNRSLLLFLGHVSKHNHGQTLTSLLKPYLEPNYLKATIQTFQLNSGFESGKTYVLENGCHKQSIQVVKVDKTRNNTFVSFCLDGKTYKKKVLESLGGNQAIKHRNKIMTSSIVCQYLLFDKDYVEFVKRVYSKQSKHMLII